MTNYTVWIHSSSPRFSWEWFGQPCPPLWELGGPPRKSVVTTKPSSEIAWKLWPAERNSIEGGRERVMSNDRFSLQVKPTSEGVKKIQLPGSNTLAKNQSVEVIGFGNRSPHSENYFQRKGKRGYHPMMTLGSAKNRLDNLVTNTAGSANCAGAK